MNKNYKNIILVFGFILSLFICYQLAFSKTLELKKQKEKLLQEEAIFKNIPKQFSLLKQKEHYYDSILTKYQLKESSLQNNLLKTLNQYAEENNLDITSFIEPHQYEQDNLITKSYSFTIEGDYNSIVKLIHHLEQKTRFGEIINLHLEKKKNFKKNSTYLQAEVLIRNFIT